MRELLFIGDYQTLRRRSAIESFGLFRFYFPLFSARISTCYAILYPMQARLGEGFGQPSQNTTQDSLYLVWRDRIGGRSLRLSLFFFFLLLLVVGVSFWRIPPQIPLAYSRPWGVAQLVPSSFLFVLLFLTLFLVISTSILAAFLFPSEQLLARILLCGLSLTLLLIDVSVFRVILLIT